MSENVREMGMDPKIRGKQLNSLDSLATVSTLL